MRRYRFFYSKTTEKTVEQRLQARWVQGLAVDTQNVVAHAGRHALDLVFVKIFRNKESSESMNNSLRPGPPKIEEA